MSKRTIRIPDGQVTDKLQRVLKAAARAITGTRKFDRGLGQTLHDQLHWLDVPDRVLFKLAVTVHQCLNGRAPPYLSEHCIPVFSADASAFRQPSPTCRRPTAFPAQHLRPSGVLSCWPDGLESLPDLLSRIQRAAQTVLGVYLKRTCSRVTSASSALGVHNDYALHKSTHSLTHSLTRTREGVGVCLRPCNRAAVKQKFNTIRRGKKCQFTP